MSGPLPPRPPGFNPTGTSYETGEASLRVRVIGKEEVEVVVSMRSDGSRTIGFIGRDFDSVTGQMAQTRVFFVDEEQASRIMTALTVFGIRPYPTLAGLE